MPPSFHSSRSRQRGFTLAEVMVATTVFAMMSMGVYAMILKSYQLTALARARDEARSVLRSYADQFERLATTEEVDEVTRNRWLFNPSGGPTGRGLVWGALSDENTSVNAEDVENLAITLGGEDHATPATITRDVRYVNAATGETSSTQRIEAAGFLLMGTFTIKYQIKGTDYTQSLTVVRAVP